MPDDPAILRHASPRAGALDFMDGGGEMGERIRAFDWSRTSLGPPAGWPQSLRTVLDIMLRSQSGIFVWWGPDLVQFYNDAYRPILGSTKHPAALGNLGRQTWAEIWHIIGPMIEAVRGRGESTGVRDGLLVLERNGFPEEGYFDYAYSPIRDESGAVAGIFAACNETTGRVIGERRLETLRALGSASPGARSPAEACEAAARVLAANANDVPFALLFLFDETGEARLVGSAGIAPQHPAAAGAAWPLRDAIASVADGGAFPVVTRPATSHLPGGPWPEPAHTAAVVPLRRQGREHDVEHAGVIVLGGSPRLPYDDAYRVFHGLVAGQVAAIVASAEAAAEARRRAEALAELDRAKTAFLSNVSHEFRTPLTLLLGPLEEVLRRTPDSPVVEVARGEIEIAHRNGRRLLRLVNTLLDFSRLEAGRVDAAYEEVDLPALTADLASTFRSAIERAGLRLVVDCPPAGEPAHVDRAMWEQIVLNLLSNAFKHTLDGEIRVRLVQVDGQFELTVADTGTGILPESLPRLFERFYRVPNARARSHEGSGIGLSLVHELVRLHGGTVAAASPPGGGATFTVTIPAGDGHLPRELLGRPRGGAEPGDAAEAFVTEATRWLPDDEPGQDGWGSVRVDPAAAGAASVLLVDDNADMRDYVVRLLADQVAVGTAANGEDALRLLRRDPLPDLVISDVMMPALDGLALLSRLRQDPRTRDLPVILLSARAGEEARIAGLAAGADDYLVKPFGARELRARVDAHVKLARLRRQAAREKDEFIAVLAHELRNPLAPIRAAVAILRVRGSGDPLLARCADVIDRQAMHMARLLDDLLDVSRLSRGQLTLQRATVELSSVIDAAAETTRPLIDQRRQQLVIRGFDGPVPLFADSGRLTQVFANLLNNASRYSHEGSRIDVVVAREAGTVAVTVRDQGIGIAADMLDRIFELFTQAGTAREHAPGGLGIGLALAYRLVSMHGGTIQVTSAGPGGGSEFTVRLPTSPSTDGAVGHVPAAIDPARLAGRRVLIVDDNVDAADMQAALLESLGCEVRTVYDGESAVDEARRFEPHLVLLDIGMPKLDGYATSTRIRSLPGGADVVLVAITGWGQEEDRMRSARAGFDVHLVKPVDMAALEELVRDVRPSE